jgi:endonuclease YncB( thermonuclease family)
MAKFMKNPKNKTVKKLVKTKIAGVLLLVLSVVGLGAYKRDLFPIINIAAEYFSDILFRGPLLPGEVIAVHDGDTITMTGEKEYIRVRLYGIDAPELSQEYGETSKDYLISLIGDKQVTLEIMDTDRYGRTVGIITSDGININEAMLNTGNAWFYGNYCGRIFCKRWETLSDSAKNKKAGLWLKGNPIPPWEFRRK